MPYKPPDGPEKYRNSEWLEQKYWDEELSTSEIAELCDCTKVTISDWMDRHDIPKRSKSERIRLSWEGEEKRRERHAEWMNEISEPWWQQDKETRERVRERLSEWWSENNPMEGKTKEQNPAWKGGGNRKYYGPNWEEQRQKRLEKDNHTCQRCGGENVNIVHHHIPIREWREDGEKDIEDANQLWNLVTVCEGCHGEIEGRRYAAMNTKQ